MPRKPPKLSTAYDTFPFSLSIITRSMEPILVPSGPYTAVPSTLSLPIRFPATRRQYVINLDAPHKVTATDGETRSLVSVRSF
jgi:hypothetical protein